MLRIAVCDDTPEELAGIAALVKQFIAAQTVAAEIRAFSHPDALLTACESEPFHIYLLDMVMPMVSGLELARSIRRNNTDAQIIFITTEPGFALDAYSVNPLNYLLKPVDQAALFAALDLAAQKVRFGAEILVTVKTKNGLCTLSADHIVCCEYVRHAAVYTLSNGETLASVTLPASFAEHIAPLLRDRRFLQPHAAYLVNMGFVERLSKDGFTLHGNAYVPVSGKQYAAVRRAYMDYRLGEA